MQEMDMKTPDLKRRLALCVALAALPALAAVNFFDPKVGAPPLLSGIGLYTNIASKTADTALKYFEVNNALWTDAASKKRWIVLPPGTHVNYVDTNDNFDYPNKTIVMKNFYLDTIVGDTTSRIYWETRILVNKEDADGNDFWYGFSYRWNKGGNDARLVTGFTEDTTLNMYYKGAGGPLSYKKWTYPGSDACLVCHRVGTSIEGGNPHTARSVLGFLPAQLKRPSPLVSGQNQVDQLFAAGVFVGTPPTALQKAARWKGMNEPIPDGPADLRFRVIDTMARSYLGSNCSGCHSERNISLTSSAPGSLNYDFFRIRPAIEFGTQGVSTLGVDMPDGDTTVLEDGHRKFMLSVMRAGVSTSPGSIWDFTRPAVMPDIKLITPGYPSLSMVLYRTMALRRPVWRDSVSYREALNASDPTGQKAWIFNKPWGSKGWRDDLAAHSIRLEQVLDFSSDGQQMPPLGVQTPDTVAMRILGEWAKNYRTLVRVPGADSVVAIRGQVLHFKAEKPAAARIENRMLIVPEGWTGKVQMIGVGGRVWNVTSVGRSRYAIPANAPSGLYFFKMGDHVFRASLLR